MEKTLDKINTQYEGLLSLGFRLTYEILGDLCNNPSKYDLEPVGYAGKKATFIPSVEDLIVKGECGEEDLQECINYLSAVMTSIIVRSAKEGMPRFINAVFNLEYELDINDVSINGKTFEEELREQYLLRYHKRLRRQKNQKNVTVKGPFGKKEPISSLGRPIKLFIYNDPLKEYTIQDVFEAYTYLVEVIKKEREVEKLV